MSIRWCPKPIIELILPGIVKFVTVIYHGFYMTLFLIAQVYPANLGEFYLSMVERRSCSTIDK